MFFKDFIFKKVHSGKLIYNCCWEDPSCDRELLKLDKFSRILMITSAGCNALDYLLDDPEHIECLDLNYRQNAVLDLKIALFKYGDYDLLWQFFGLGKCKNARQVYKSNLRPFLKEESRKFWDKKIKYFTDSGIRNSFYFRGASGFLAWMAGRYFQVRPSLRKNIKSLFEAASMEEQIQLYDKVQKSIFRSVFSKSFNNSAVLSLAGVPLSQHGLVSRDEANGTVSYLERSFRNTFTRMPANNNYFYRLYFFGEYDHNCCPNYLKKEHFNTIQKRVDRISFQTEGIEQFLEKNQSSFSHFVLLDHMDWLAQNNPQGLEKEWELILERSYPNAKVLFRTAAPDLSFMPVIFFSNFGLNEVLTDEISKKDRVGMYRITALAEKKHQ